jgi:hypothetical protein
MTPPSKRSARTTTSIPASNGMRSFTQNDEGHFA